MKVSVVIPVFNGEAYLRRAVDSVLATGYPHVEVLIVDDGSTDGSSALASQIAEETRGTVRLFRHPGGGNRGVSAARNLGIRESTGEIVCFLDADDFFLPHRFRVALPLLEARPYADGVYETCEVRHAEGYSDGLGANCVFGVREPLEGLALLRHLLETSAPWSTSAITLRRAVFGRCGVFPEAVRIAEDCHLWFRLAAVATIVPGDLAHPVSVYWRHERNTYSPSLEHRLTMVHVMGDVWRWSRPAGVSARGRRVLLSGVQNYLWRSLVAVRSAGHRRLAWRVVGAAIRAGGPRLALDRRIVRQFLSMSRDLCR